MTKKTAYEHLDTALGSIIKAKKLVYPQSHSLQCETDLDEACDKIRSILAKIYNRVDGYDV